MLDKEKVYAMIDYAQKWSVENVSFTAAGEALLDARLLDFVGYARVRNVALISLVTNGLLLEEKGEKLLEAGLNRMTISIDGATPETYRRIQESNLDKVERGVRKCVEYAEKLNAQGRGIEFEVACVLVDAEVENQKDLYLAKWSDCRDVIKRITFNNLAVFDGNGDYVRTNADIDFKHRNVCSEPFWKIMINPYGDVTTCCHMSSSAYHYPYSIGNIYDLDFEKIWNGEKAKILRKESLEIKFNVFSVCEKCSEWAYNNWNIGESVESKEKSISFK